MIPAATARKTRHTCMDARTGTWHAIVCDGRTHIDYFFYANGEARCARFWGHTAEWTEMLNNTG